MLWFLLGYLTGTVLCLIINYRNQALQQRGQINHDIRTDERIS